MYTIVRVENAQKLAVMDKFFGGVEHEQVGEDTDIWFEGKRDAKKAVKELKQLGFDADILYCEIKTLLK